jgi:hypothetical protein
VIITVRVRRRWHSTGNVRGHADERALAGMGVLDNACALPYPGQYALLRYLKAAGLLLEQFGQPHRGAVVEHRTDELHSDRQTLRPARGYGGGGQAGHGGQARAYSITDNRRISLVKVGVSCSRLSADLGDDHAGRHQRYLLHDLTSR